MTDPALIGAEVICCALIFATVFFAVVGSANHDGSSPATKDLIMKLDEAAAAISTAAHSISTAAQSLSDAATKLAGANDTSALDQPVNDLNNAVVAMTAAAASITALVPAAE